MMTKRKGTRSGRKTADAKIRGILEAAPDGMVIADADGRVLLVNSQTERLFGYTREELVRQPVEMLIPERFRARHAGHRVNYSVDARPRPMGAGLELVGRRKDGSEFPVEISLSPLEAEAGILVIAAVRDVTDRTQAERRQALHFTVTSILADSGTISEAAARISEAVCRSAGWELGEFWVVDAEARALRWAGGWSDPSIRAEEFEALSREVKLERGVGLQGRVWAGEEPEWVADVQGHPHFLRAVAAAELGLRTAAAAPIPGPAETAGVLLLLSRNTLPTDEQLLATLRDVGHRIGMFIHRKQTEEALARSEEHVRQLQRLEAIGRLAGGIAHDFNNLLTVILGRCRLLLSRLPEDAPPRKEIGLIENTAERAASLTRQLLAFSRKQILEPKVLDFNAVVSGMAKMLERLIGENIELLFGPASDLWRVKVDPGQLEQVIMNLALNARDAMPDGGRLTIETANVELGEPYARQHVGVRAGPYVMLAVTDTGVGIDADVQARIFEPFFTTKEPGKGTGLGLSTVYGIVKQSGGNIWVYSEPGHGTTFKVYLPLAAGEAAAVEAVQAAPGRGTETILLAEDDDEVRELAREILESYGYTVLAARAPKEALLIADRHTGPIHLLLTDVVMPDMGGRVLADRLAPVRPEMKVLYVSGYTDNSIVHRGALEEGTPFVQKPFTPEGLARKVREVLDSPD